ncbi:META domain-containing protein [Fibrisoma montanum]|nr:META domain-containing protein [Fibrisoma montanum]
MKTLFVPVRSRSRLINRLAYSLTALLVAGMLWACNKNDTVAPSSVDTVALKNMRASFNALEGEWLLTNFRRTPLTPDLQNKATLILTKKAEDALQIGGRSFVNWYGGSFRLDETKGLVVSTEPIISTLMAGTPEQMDAESRHVNGLEQITYFELTADNQLNLYLGDRNDPATEVIICTKK